MSPAAAKVDRERLTREALGELAARGVLLQADGRLASVVLLVVGEPIRGSWWSHPLAHEIYAVCEGLNDHPDVTVAKLVTGKVTYVHRALWPALVAIGRAREDWQMKGLSRAALGLLERVTGAGPLRADRIDAPASAVRELEARLLAHIEEVHTERGAHAKQLSSWSAWAKRVRLPAAQLSPGAARAALEERAAALFTGPRPRKLLPWR
jgi:hypothetical protein